MSTVINPQINFADYLNNQNNGLNNVNNLSNSNLGLLPLSTNQGASPLSTDQNMSVLGPLSTNYANGFGGGSTPTPANDTNSNTQTTEQTENLPDTQQQQEQQTENKESNKKKATREKEIYPREKTEGYEVEYEDGSLSFVLPDYGYDKYIMDIANWQRQRVSYGAEPGYYYFKIFFNFKTNFGLLGGLMMTIDGRQRGAVLASKNSAYGYLKTVLNRHISENIPERILALSKFGATLKDISLRTPWMFKTLSGLNTINSTYVNNFDKEKIITIGCNQESLDSRIGTLIDLYKYACFDSINCKEIIPANLRKFEMSIMVYHMPLNNYHNRAMTDGGNAQKQGIGATFWRSLTGQTAKGLTNLTFDGDVKAKVTNTDGTNGNYSDMMSFKLFTFLNCEIDLENANEYYTDGMSNESAFQLGNNQIKIKYDRVYEHRMNEWAQMFFGSDGFYYNATIPDVFKAYYGQGIERNAVKYQNEDGEEIIYDGLADLGKDINFYINNNGANNHEKRITALSKKWIGYQPSGIMSILDYQKLLIGKYYAPVNTPVPANSIIGIGLGEKPFSITDMMTTINHKTINYPGHLGGKIYNNDGGIFQGLFSGHSGNNNDNSGLLFGGNNGRNIFRR